MKRSEMKNNILRTVSAFMLGAFVLSSVPAYAEETEKRTVYQKASAYFVSTGDSYSVKLESGLLDGNGNGLLNKEAKTEYEKLGNSMLTNDGRAWNLSLIRDATDNGRILARDMAATVTGGVKADYNYLVKIGFIGTLGGETPYAMLGGFSFMKVSESDPAMGISGAKYNLRAADGGYVEFGAGGRPKYDDLGRIVTTQDLSRAGVYETGFDGSFVADYLPVGSYTLVEIETPPGYEKGEDMEINIAWDGKDFSRSTTGGLGESISGICTDGSVFTPTWDGALTAEAPGLMSCEGEQTVNAADYGAKIFIGSIGDRGADYVRGIEGEALDNGGRYMVVQNPTYELRSGNGSKCITDASLSEIREYINSEIIGKSEIDNSYDYYTIARSELYENQAIIYYDTESVSRNSFRVGNTSGEDKNVQRENVRAVMVPIKVEVALDQYAEEDTCYYYSLTGSDGYDCRRQSFFPAGSEAGSRETLAFDALYFDAPGSYTYSIKDISEIDLDPNGNNSTNQKIADKTDNNLTVVVSSTVKGLVARVYLNGAYKTAYSGAEQQQMSEGEILENARIVHSFVNGISPAVYLFSDKEGQHLKAGEYVTYTITVANSTNAPLNGVTVSDLLDPRLELVGWSVKTIDPNTGEVTVTYPENGYSGHVSVDVPAAATGKREVTPEQENQTVCTQETVEEQGEQTDIVYEEPSYQMEETAYEEDYTQHDEGIIMPGEDMTETAPEVQPEDGTDEETAAPQDDVTEDVVMDEQVTEEPYEEPYDAPVTYTLNITNGEGGGAYAPGETVTIYADCAPVGKRFTGWSVEGQLIELQSSEKVSFVMPEADLNISAVYDDCLIVTDYGRVEITLFCQLGNACKYRSENSASNIIINQASIAWGELRRSSACVSSWLRPAIDYEMKAVRTTAASEKDGVYGFVYGDKGIEYKATITNKSDIDLNMDVIQQFVQQGNFANLALVSAEHGSLFNSSDNEGVITGFGSSKANVTVTAGQTAVLSFTADVSDTAKENTASAGLNGEEGWLSVTRTENVFSANYKQISSLVVYDAGGEAVCAYVIGSDGSSSLSGYDRSFLSTHNVNNLPEGYTAVTDTRSCTLNPGSAPELSERQVNERTPVRYQSKLMIDNTTVNPTDKSRTDVGGWVRLIANVQDGTEPANKDVRPYEVGVTSVSWHADSENFWQHSGSFVIQWYDDEAALSAGTVSGSVTVEIPKSKGEIDVTKMSSATKRLKKYFPNSALTYVKTNDKLSLELASDGSLPYYAVQVLVSFEPTAMVFNNTHSKDSGRVKIQDYDEVSDGRWGGYTRAVATSKSSWQVKPGSIGLRVPNQNNYGGFTPLGLTGEGDVEQFSLSLYYTGIGNVTLNGTAEYRKNGNGGVERVTLSFDELNVPLDIGVEFSVRTDTNGNGGFSLFRLLGIRR